MTVKHKTHSFLSYCCLFCCCLFSVASCNNVEDDSGLGNADDFAQTDLLTNFADNLIVPSYLSLAASADNFDAKLTTFASDLTIEDVGVLRSVFSNTYTLWQDCSVFEIGPAADVQLRSSLNTFPTNLSKIEANINTGSYNLAAADNLDAKGFPALDFLLFGTGSDDTQVLDYYTNPDLGEARIAYLQAVSNDLITAIRFVLENWQNTYKNTFINNTGTSIGSSVSLLVNELNFDYELLKRAKVGIPLGKFTLGEPQPEKVEAFYHQENSKNFLLLNLKSIQDVFEGISHAGVNGVGFVEYLDHLESTTNNGDTLSTAIITQFDLAEEAINAIPSNLSEAVVNNTEIVDNAYTELQKLVVLLKTDMTSALGVSITYNDNDGD